MPTAKKMLQVAASYIGVNGDQNIFNKWYWVDYTKTYSHDPGTAWCACFQSYVAMKAGLKCSYSASAAGFATQFERIPVEKENTVKPGDIVIFNWDGRTSTGWADHVGIVEWSTIGQDGLFGTIEGNTGNAPEGQVLRVTRTNWGGYFTAFYRPKYDSETSVSGSTQETPSQKTPVEKSGKLLYGIDVSSNQPENIMSMVKADFGIVKMSGNPHGYSWNFVNPFAKKQVSDIHKKTGMSGLYHFTYGKDAVTEAKFFVDQVRKLGYLGKSILIIDYEAQALELGRNWVARFAKTIVDETGVTPVIYASGSVITSQKLFDLGYPMWCASYYKSYQEIDGYDTSGMKIWPGCEKSILWQFTSEGYLDGYGKSLDMNVCYITKEEWQKLATSNKGASPAASSKPSSSSEKTTPKPKLSTPSKSISTIAGEVLSGKWGNGEERKKKLEAAGYSYEKVQAEVNKLVKQRDLKTVAKQVIQGRWGNGEDRKERLEAAGYSYAEVQAVVNDLLA